VSEITLVRQAGLPLEPADKDAARKVLFGIVDGLGDQGRKQWRRFFNMLMRLEPGEMVEIRTHKERIGLHHRRHMLLEQRVFEAQERFQAFKDFRVWLKCGAGFVDWFPGPKGGVIPVPKSISYSALEELEMQQVHDDMVTFLRTPHATKTLWKHLSLPQQGAAIESILAELHEL